MTNQIPRFKARNQEEGRHSVVGDCNGHSCEERWEKETPLFARAVLSYLPAGGTTILDYGCGVGRLAKEILRQNKKVTVLGLDASEDELRLAREYVNDSRFLPILPGDLAQKVDLAYCIYVLQHVPAIELRHVIERMHHALQPGGVLVYCSSDYRMAINNGGGFTDDRHLGVDIRKEVERLFEPVEDLFKLAPLDRNGVESLELQLLRDLITAEGCPPGSIPHPAIVYRARKIASNHYFQVGFAPQAAGGAGPSEGPRDASHARPVRGAAKRLILQNRQAPGDILVMTAAIRALHKAYPGQFLTDVEGPTGTAEIMQNNPYITSLNGDGQKIDMHYPLISDVETRGFKMPGAGISGRHFSDGHRKFLEEVLECEIPRAGLVPDLVLSQDERLWPSPALGKGGYEGRYWALNAGTKTDFTLKQYHRWQEVVDLLLKAGVRVVQIGAGEHNHPALRGVIDLRGKTDHRELYRTIYHADGVLTCVSYPMHIAAALGKPAVVVAGGRESTRWELYPNHRFLYTNGALPCCAYDGCWKSRGDECLAMVSTWKPGEEDPGRLVEGEMAPKCMELIKPQQIVDALMLYYEGGILQPIQEEILR